jgi:serine/threonine-protein kinase
VNDPSSIGPYRVIRRLGSGGMGEVFLAHDPRLDRQVAVKRIHTTSGGDVGRRSRFLREARVTAALSHPAIVQVFDLVSEGDADHIVMEYVPGTTLHQLLRAGALPLTRGLPIAVAVAEGLAEAHRSGVVHRDLKAENVLLTADGRAKISDFGIAHRPWAAGDESLTREGAVLGTHRVMSPEQACGDATDARSDLFSFGILLYEMFTGRSPFLAETGLATVQRVMQLRQAPAAEAVPGLPRELSELIDHLLEKEPMLRPRDAAEVAGRLRTLATGEGGGEATLPPAGQPASRAESPSYAPLPLRKRRRWWIVAAVCGLFGLAAVIAVGVLGVRVRAPVPAVPPLSVAVLEPRLRGGPPDEESTFLGFAIRGALENALTAFAGVSPKGGREVDAVAGKPAEVARAVAADEVLEPAFVCREGSCTVEVSRLRGADGTTIWSGQIEIPRAEPLTAARALAVLVRAAYPERRLRPDAPALAASPADYADYLKIQQAVVAGDRQAGGATALERLAAIRGRSPGFVEAYLLAAKIEANRGLATRDPTRTGAALTLLARAREIAPGDPEVGYVLTYTSLQAGRLAEAEAALAGFEQLVPGDVRVLDLRSALLEQRGRPAEALALSRAAVERQPSWVRLYEYAKLAWRQGQIESARHSLETLLARFPGNASGRSLLAAVELTNGDPARAATLYEELAAGSPDPATLVNLGLARMLLGDYDRAAFALEHAVAAAPGNDLFLLNLAQVRWLQGRRAEAEPLFRRVLALSAAERGGAEWQRLTARAQALAQLGRSQEAVAAVQEALRLAPRSGQAAYEASLVYAVAGDRTAALVNVGRARGLGFDAPAWFRLPWFDSLRGDSGFRRFAGPVSAPMP